MSNFFNQVTDLDGKILNLGLRDLPAFKRLMGPGMGRPTSDDLHYRVAEKREHDGGGMWWYIHPAHFNAEDQAIQYALDQCAETGNKMAVYPSDLTVDLATAEMTNPPRVLFVTLEQIMGDDLAADYDRLDPL